MTLCQSTQSMIEVTKTLFWKSPRLGCRLNAHVFGYSSVNDRRLIGTIGENAFDQVGKTLLGQTAASLIHSDNDGSDWTQEEPFSVIRETEEGIIHEVPQTVFLDARHDICLFFYLRRWVKDPHAARQDIKKYSHQLYRISRDGGRTWEDEHVLVQKGEEYDQTHYARDIRFGYNAGFVTNEPIQLRNGKILAPLFLWPWDEKLKAANATKKQCAVLIGTWDQTLSRIEWDLGEYTQLTDETGSLSEITVAELDDGTILGIMRAGSSSRGGLGKFYCISKDGGWTWSVPQRLAYDNGEPLYSPSSISRLIRSSRNGKLYWIANLLPFRQDMYVNTPSNLVRFVLQIAEVNEENYGIKKETMTTIDKSKDSENPKEYSNPSVYEHRDSGNFILTMCEACALPLRGSEIPNSYQGPFMTEESFTSHSYQYEIKL